LSTIGVTGLPGAFNTSFTCRSLGIMLGRNGWDAGFAVFVICSMVGVLLFAICWQAKADGYTTTVVDE
jgi:sugar phosphate permease